MWGVTRYCFSEWTTVHGNSMGEADKVKMRFRGSKGNRVRNGSILLRRMDPARGELGPVEVLAELVRTRGTADDIPIRKVMEGVDEGASDTVSEVRPREDGREVEGRREGGDGRDTS